MSRRRGSNGNLVVICWRDIPAQVNAGSGSSKIQRILPRRFQRAIDRAATVAGKTQASEYVGEWRRKVIPGDPADPEGAALRAAEEFESAFPLARLDAFVATGGWDPETGEPALEEIEPPGTAGAHALSTTVSPQEATT